MPEFNTMELMVVAASAFWKMEPPWELAPGRRWPPRCLPKNARPGSGHHVRGRGNRSRALQNAHIRGDSRSYYKSVMASGMCDIMESCQRGMVDYTFLGGAQIDMYGNLNSTVIGNWEKPKARLPGSGGANDFASFC